jgi:ubiquinone/menaquinone biosynthesis C-methylase UbiE
LPDSHVAIARRFASTTCLDISAKGLELAKAKLGGNGEYVLGSILDVPAPDGRFDAVFCAHVIYHIDLELQETAVRELIRVTRPGGRVVVIYANPDSLPGRLVELKGRTPMVWRLKRKELPGKPQVRERPPLYFFAHPLGWWQRFADGCAVELIP